MRELRVEHARLLDEIEVLRQEQRKLKEGTDRPKAEKAPEGETEQNKQEPKEPAQIRAAHWASAHPLTILAMLSGSVVLVVMGAFLWRYLHSYESTDDAEVSGHINQIGSRIPGTIVGVYVENSQAVRKGQVLVDLDPRDYQVAAQHVLNHRARCNRAARRGEYHAALDKDMSSPARIPQLAKPAA